MYSFAQKSLSVLLIASLLRGMAHLGLLFGLSVQAPLAENNLSSWIESATSIEWNDLLNALAEQKKDEKEESEEKRKEKEGSEKEELSRQNEFLTRKKAIHYAYQLFGYGHLPAESLLKTCQCNCKVALQRIKTRYISYHASFSQKLYLRNHSLKIPCPAFV